MSIVFVLIAAGFVALSNLAMRKSIDMGGNAKVYLFSQMVTAFLVAVLVSPIRTGNFSINPWIIGLGSIAGLILALMLYCLGKAVEKGPPGITFSIINAATVMPGLLMALLFGAAYGFAYTGWHGIGSLLVLAGLFWAGRGAQGILEKKSWALFSFSMFALHVLLLALFQWRVLLMNENPAFQSEWFMPCMYFASALFQAGVYLGEKERSFRSGEVLYGILGGGANCLCSFFLIWATETATSLENAVIFPVFSVFGIILSNIWGQKLYQEQVNWRACQVCALGLIVGTVDWKTVAVMIGF